MSDCPKCGCGDTRIIPRRSSGFGWGVKADKQRAEKGEDKRGHTPKVRMECRYCGEQFMTDDRQTRPELELNTRPDVGTTYQTPVIGGATCPACGHHPWKVTRTLKDDGGPRIRHHKCAQCGETGKSAE